MNKKQKIICTELNEILKGIEDKYISRIPKQVIDTIKYFADYEEVNLTIDWDKPLTSQKFDEDTINILAWINYKFWVEKPEEKQKLKKLFFSNKNINREPEEEERNLLEEAFKIYEEEHTNILLPKERNNFIERLLDKIRRKYE